MFKKIAAAAALAILSTTAVAQTSAPLYFGADFGSTKLDGASDRESSYGIFAGYQFTPMFAAELGFRRMADFNDTFAGTRADVTIDQTAISLIGTLPLQRGFNVFGRLGYNDLRVKANVRGFSGSESDDGLLLGIGLGYQFTNTVSGRIEVQRPSSDSSNISAGIAFAF